MSFAALVTDMTDVCFAQLAEPSTYTAPTEGAVAVACRTAVDEPNEPMFDRQIPGAESRARHVSLWLFRSEIAAGAKGATVTQTSTGRTFTLVGMQHRDPDREQWAVREVSA